MFLSLTKDSQAWGLCARCCVSVSSAEPIGSSSWLVWHHFLGKVLCSLSFQRARPLRGEEARGVCILRTRSIRTTRSRFRVIFGGGHQFQLILFGCFDCFSWGLIFSVFWERRISQVCPFCCIGVPWQSFLVRVALSRQTHPSDQGVSQSSSMQISTYLSHPSYHSRIRFFPVWPLVWSHTCAFQYSLCTRTVSVCSFLRSKCRAPSDRPLQKTGWSNGQCRQSSTWSLWFLLLHFQSWQNHLILVAAQYKHKSIVQSF